MLENAVNLYLPVVADETGSVRRHNLNLVTDVSILSRRGQSAVGRIINDHPLFMVENESGTKKDWFKRWIILWHPSPPPVDAEKYPKALNAEAAEQLLEVVRTYLK